MTTTITKSPVRDLFSRPDVTNKFREILGKRSTQFVTSVLQIVAQSDLLAGADPMSIYNAAMTAATLDLPINQNLGFAYILPYRTKDKGQLAQFQLGYKGFIQLAQRSGQFRTISATPIYEGQIASENPLTGYVFDFTLPRKGKIVGYAAYFQLINGFEKTLYMTVDELNAHGKKYSQTFKKGYGLWDTDFDAMATKTVIKLLLSKYAPLSVEMQRAIVSDQAVINDYETEEVSYVDNTPDKVDHSAQLIGDLIAKATTAEDLEALQEQIIEQGGELEGDQLGMFRAKKQEIESKIEKL